MMRVYVSCDEDDGWERVHVDNVPVRRPDGTYYGKGAQLVWAEELIAAASGGRVMPGECHAYELTATRVEETKEEG